MLTSCDDHQDFIVIYDTPILASCPVCTMDNELYEANDKAEEVPDLKQEVQILKGKIEDLEVQLAVKNKNLDEYCDEELDEKEQDNAKKI